MKHRKILLLFTGIALSGLLGWLAAEKVHFAKVLEILNSDLNIANAGIALSLYLGFFICKALRWRIMLKPYVEVSWIRLLPYIFIGYGGNVLAPMQLGELVRGAGFSRHYSLPTIAVLSGIALEKLLDLYAVLALVSLIVIGTRLNTDNSLILSSTAYSLSIFLSIAGVVLGFLFWRKQLVLSPLEYLLNKYEKNNWISKVLSWLIESCEAVLSLKKHFTAISIMTLVMWIFMLFSLYFSILSVELSVTLSVTAIVFILTVVGLVLPTSPGFVGTIQAAFVFGMIPFGFNQEQAIAASIFYNGLITIPPIVAAIISLWYLQRKNRILPNIY